MAGRTGLSAIPYVRKYLASSEQEPRYRRSKFPSKLDDYEQAATSWILSETINSRKQRQKVKYHHQV
jgi:hypothetical protein